LGFTTGDYLDASGRRFSLVEQLSNGGQVSGVSANYRFPGSYSAWLYDNGSTARVGLVDAQHTSPNGRQESHVRLLNNSGRAAGYSYSYLGETPTNRTAWVYDGHVSKRIGLLDDSQSSDVQFLNEAGQVVGYSDFYASGCNLRHAAWFYDPSLDESIPLVFWTGTDGYVSTDPWYLGEDGTVVGSYAKGTLQNHVHLAFFWSREEGFYSLGELVDGGLSQSGWDLLRVADRIDRLGQIGGVGYLTGRSGLVPYVMTPIPEPADIGWSIALPFALGCRRHARRRGRTLKTCPHT
jgi:hypothetical protein